MKDEGVTVTLLISAVRNPFAVDDMKGAMRAVDLEDVILEKWTFVIDLKAKSSSGADPKTIERTGEVTCRGFDAFIQQMPLSSLVRKPGSVIRMRQRIVEGDCPDGFFADPRKQEKAFEFSCNEGSFHVVVTYTDQDFSNPNSLENLFPESAPSTSSSPSPFIAFPVLAPSPPETKGPSPHSMVDPTVLRHAIPDRLTTDSCALLIHPVVPDEEKAKTMPQEEWFTFLQSYDPAS